MQIIQNFSDKFLKENASHCRNGDGIIESCWYRYEENGRIWKAEFCTIDCSIGTTHKSTRMLRSKLNLLLALREFQSKVCAKNAEFSNLSWPKFSTFHRSQISELLARNCKHLRTPKWRGSSLWKKKSKRNSWIHELRKLYFWKKVKSSGSKKQSLEIF